MKNRILISPRQRGQSLVELGLTLMILLWLLSGAVTFGIGFFSYVAIRDAAQEGALYGSIDPTGDIEARVRSSSSAPVNLADTTAVQVDADILPADSICAGSLLTVLVTYDYPVTMPLIGIITGPTILLQAAATSTLLLPDCP